MRILRNPAFLAVCLSHFSVDVLNGQFAVLLAALSGPLGLTNASIGLIAAVYSLAGAAAQPFFGWLADRHGPRWAVAGGVLWMALFFSLFALTPDCWPVVCLVLASFGSAAFHPPGAHRAAQIGRTDLAGRAATAASLFFLFGQGGLSLGPALGGFIMQYLDRIGVLIVAALTAPVGVFAAHALRPGAEPTLTPAAAARGEAAPRPAPRPQFMLLGIVLALAGLRVWAQVAATTFVPKYLDDQGVVSSTYGVVVALFMAGSAIGGVAAGILADRWGKVRIVLAGFALSIVPLFALPLVGGPVLYLVATLAGFMNGAPHSILVTLAQSAMPGRGSLASGLSLGFMFAAGAVGSSLTGLAADHFGLQVALQLSALVAAAGVLLTPLLRLPGARQTAAPTGR